MPTSKKENKRRIPPITIENAKLTYKNFSGTAKRFNAKGLRNFAVILDNDLAKVLEQDGWNVKWPKAREDGEERNPTLKVSLRFDNYPPRIVLITKGNKSILDEESVSILDWAEIQNVDIVLNPYSGEVDGKPYVKAYLSKMFVTLNENDLESKYADMSSARRSDLDAD